MKDKKSTIYAIALCIGLSTICINILIDTYLGSDFQAIRWVIVGIGAGLTGSAASYFLTKLMYKKNPKLAHQAIINKYDERNILIRNSAAHYMWFVSIFILVAFTLIFTILKIKIAALVSVIGLILYIAIYIYLLFKLNKDL